MERFRKSLSATSVVKVTVPKELNPRSLLKVLTLQARQTAKPKTMWMKLLLANAHTSRDRFDVYSSLLSGDSTWIHKDLKRPFLKEANTPYSHLQLPFLKAT